MSPLVPATQSTPRSSASPPTNEKTNAEKKQHEDGLLAKGKRKLLGLGKKEGGEKAQEPEGPTADSRAKVPASMPTLLPSPPLTTSPPRRPSPRGSPRIHPAGIGASPSRRTARSSSPGLHSPASSQIFERNVQEESEASSAVPAHMALENHIPPALEASTIAITNDHLNPDEVEIVMHSAHQPASAAVAASVADSIYAPSLTHEDASTSHPDLADSASNPNYGSLDTTDVRRLSFISFADVVQAEHDEHAGHADAERDAVQFMSLSETANRSPSPVRSPASSHGFNASPPLSGLASEKGAGTRIPGSLPGSPTVHGAQSPPLGGELQIETMRQALRKTGSGDLSGARSQPLSAVSLDESSADQPPFK